jgi:hypothetical protein
MNGRRPTTKVNVQTRSSACDEAQAMSAFECHFICHLPFALIRKGLEPVPATPPPPLYDVNNYLRYHTSTRYLSYFKKATSYNQPALHSCDRSADALRQAWTHCSLLCRNFLSAANLAGMRTSGRMAVAIGSARTATRTGTLLPTASWPCATPASTTCPSRNLSDSSTGPSVAAPTSTLLCRTSACRANDCWGEHTCTVQLST